MRSSISFFIGLFAVLGFVGSTATAFEVDGIRSGMTVAQIKAVLEPIGFEVWESPLANNWLYGRRKDLQINGNVFICGGGVASVINDIDFDKDYVSTLRELMDKYGQPKKTTIQDNAWVGPGGGRVLKVVTSWYAGSERISLSMGPEGRDSKGVLRYTRSATIEHADRGACPVWKDANWW